jgi:hypothetical protein
MFKHRFRYLLIVPLLLAGLWFAWPSPPKNDDSAANPTAAKPGSRAISPSETDGAGNTRPTRVRERPPADTDETSAQVSRILADDKISTADAAVMLHALAADASLPVAHRLEALEHGLNLDMAPFARFAEVPDLPTELAALFLDAVINYNESPEIQIQSYLALINHPDPEVSASATDMLAFIVEDDQREASPATLVQMAKQKLAELRKAAPITH